MPPNPRPYRHTIPAEVVALFGKMTDKAASEAAKALNHKIGPRSVANARKDRGIPAYAPAPDNLPPVGGHRPALVITDAIREELGRVPDSVLAERYGVERRTIQSARRRLGRPPVGPKGGKPGRLAKLTPAQLALSPSEIRKIVPGASDSGISKARAKVGVQGPRAVARGKVKADTIRKPVLRTKARMMEAELPPGDREAVEGKVRAEVVPASVPTTTMEDRAMQGIARARAAGKPEPWIEERYAGWL